MAAKYDGKTAAEWLEVADDAQYQAGHTVNDDTKDYWLGVYKTATLKALIADGLDDDNDTTSGGGDTQTLTTTRYYEELRMPMLSTAMQATSRFIATMATIQSELQPRRTVPIQTS